MNCSPERQDPCSINYFNLRADTVVEDKVAFKLRDATGLLRKQLKIYVCVPSHGK